MQSISKLSLSSSIYHHYFNAGNFHIPHRVLLNLLEEFPIPVPKYQMLVGCLQRYPLPTEHESQADLVDSDVLLHKGQVHSWKNESRLQHANCHKEQLVSSASEVKYLDELVSLKCKNYLGFSLLLMNIACDITSNMNTWEMLQVSELSVKNGIEGGRCMTQSHVTNSTVLMFITNCNQYDQHKHWNSFAIQKSIYFHKLSIASNKKYKTTLKCATFNKNINNFCSTK